MTLQATYTLVFALAAVACFLSIRGALDVTSGETRVGMVALLALSGAWATATAARLVVPTRSAQITFYVVGLVVGLATVGAWLYFCSAYAGYDYHRRSSVRYTAVAIYVGISTVKITNPLHSLYFTVLPEETLFGRVVLELSIFHWTVTGLSYALTAIGFYLLYELFSDSQFRTTRLGALVGLTALPAVFDIVTLADFAPDLWLPLNYEPIGVALFAVGVLYIVDETFVAVPRTWRKEVFDRFEDPILLVDFENRLRDCNSVAEERFPALRDAHGALLDTVAPELAAGMDDAEQIIETTQRGMSRYYTAQTTPLAGNTETAGRVIVYKDVTNIERHRRELQRQNDQLSEFSTVLNHELRNAITVIQGYLDHATATADGGQSAEAEAVLRATNAAERMERVIGDLTTLARYGQTPTERSDCDLRSVAAHAWEQTATRNLSYHVEADGHVVASEPRLEMLLRYFFQLADANDATEVTITLADATLTLSENGEQLPPDPDDQLFEFGPPTPSEDIEMALPSIRLLAQVHDWTIAVDTAHTDGVRLDIENVTVSH